LGGGDLGLAPYSSTVQQDNSFSLLSYANRAECNNSAEVFFGYNDCRHTLRRTEVIDILRREALVVVLAAVRDHKGRLK